MHCPEYGTHLFLYHEEFKLVSLSFDEQLGLDNAEEKQESDKY